MLTGKIEFTPINWQAYFAPKDNEAIREWRKIVLKDEVDNEIVIGFHKSDCGEIAKIFTGLSGDSTDVAVQA